MKRRLHDWLLRHWYSSRPIWFLIPFAWLFIGLTALRRGLYRMRVLLPRTLPAPVIVVGNLNVGGSGKTPCTLWLAEILKAAGYRPGIITRGYGGTSSHWPRAVTRDSNPREVGDEAVLLAQRSGLPVVAGPDRIAAATLLIEQHQVKVILSDDGLQHYRLPRNAEIIMLDGVRGLGNGWRLPAGPLREPKQRLDSAAFVVIKAGNAHPAKVPENSLVMRLELEEAVAISTGERHRLSDFAGLRVHAVAGIADPEQFFAALEARGLQVHRHALPDHALPEIHELVFADGLPVFMTEKDAVKCRTMQLVNSWYVPVTARFSATDETRLLSGLSKCLLQSGA